MPCAIRWLGERFRTEWTTLLCDLLILNDDHPRRIDIWAPLGPFRALLLQTSSVLR